MECNGHANELIADGSGNFRIDDNGSERLRIDSGGRLLVGDSNASGAALVQVQKTSGDMVLVRNHATNYESLILSVASGTADIYASSGGSTSRPALRFITNDAERLRIKSDGKVVVGNSSGSGTGALTIYPASLTGNGRLDVYGGGDENTQNAARNEVMRIGRGDILDQYYHSIWSATGSGGANSHFLKFYVSNGTAGATSQKEALSMNGLGHVTKPNQPGFECSNPDSYNTSGSPSNWVTSWTRIHHNYGSHFDGSTGKFTAPVNGRYLFTVHMTNVSHSSPHVAFGINGGTASGPSRSGTNYTELWHIGSDSGDGVNLTHIFDLSANDYVVVWLYGYTGTSDDPRCYFAGYLLG